ncbi:MAG: hypothetical protein HQM11_10095 [SAR324 cluster bacterium]|nr:hypothetical protein [SAR324 cluster bacterium]
MTSYKRKKDGEEISKISFTVHKDVFMKFKEVTNEKNISIPRLMETFILNYLESVN